MRLAMVFVAVGCGPDQPQPRYVAPVQARDSSPPEDAPPYTYEAPRYVESPPATPARPKEGRTGDGVVYGEVPLFCFEDSSDAELSTCRIGKSKCDEFRLAMVKSKPMTECSPTGAGACFAFDYVVSGRKDVACDRTMGACLASWNALRANPDVKVLSECRVYRYRAL